MQLGTGTGSALRRPDDRGRGPYGRPGKGHGRRQRVPGQILAHRRLARQNGAQNQRHGNGAHRRGEDPAAHRRARPPSRRHPQPETGFRRSDGRGHRPDGPRRRGRSCRPGRSPGRADGPLWKPGGQFRSSGTSAQ